MLAFVTVLSYLIWWEAVAENLLIEFCTRKPDEKQNIIDVIIMIFICCKYYAVLHKISFFFFKKEFQVSFMKYVIP